MLITLKRFFVYFLIVNYLQLTLMPSFAFAMEKDEILQALPRLEPIKPSSVEERDGWEAPAVLSPAIASQALPVLTISLHRQENGSFQLKMQQTGAAVYSEFLPKGKIAKDYQGHKIDLNLGDALTTQVVFTTINPACNYLFDIDGHLNLGGSLETEGYFQVKKANSFSLPANLLADSGLFLDNIKTLTQEGSTAPRVIAKRGAIDIKQTGDPLELKAVLEARTGIRIEADTGDLIIASDIKTPSTIFLKSKGNTLLKKTSLIGVGGIEITSAGTVMSSEGLPTLITNKRLGVTAKSIDLKAGNYVALEGIHLQGDDVSVGSETSEPLLQSNGSIRLKGKEKLFVKSGVYHSREELILEGSDIVVGVPKTGMYLNPFWQQMWADQMALLSKKEEAPSYVKSKTAFDKHYIENLLLPDLRKLTSRPVYLNYESFIKAEGTGYRKGMDLNEYQQLWINSPKYQQLIKDKGLTLPVYELPIHLSKVPTFQAHKQLTVQGDKVTLNRGDLRSLAGIKIEASRGYLTIGSNVSAPELVTKGDLMLTAGQQAHLNNGVLTAEKMIKVTAATHKLTLGNRSGACPQLTAGQSVDLSGGGVDLLMANLTAQKGITADATTGQLQAGTASTIPVLKSNTLINLKGKREIWMLNGVYTSLGDITLNSNNIILGQGSTSVELTSHNLLTCTGGNIHIFKANLKGVKGVKFNATSGYISIGKESIISEIKTKGNIILIADQYINLVQGIFEAEEAITATSTNHTIDVGDNRSAPQLISGQHTSLVGNQVNVVNGSFSSKQNTILHAKKQAVNFGAGGAKPHLKAGQFVTITSTAPVNLKGGTIEGKSGITLDTQGSKLSLTQASACLLKTPGTLSIQSTGGVDLFKTLNDTGSISLVTGAKDFVLGEKGKPPLNLHLAGSFSFSGAGFYPVNGNILTKGNLSIQAGKAITFGDQILHKQGKLIYPYGNGQYLMTLSHLQIKAPSLTLIGASLGGATANFEIAVLTNTGGFIDIKGDVNGTMTHLTNQLMSFSLADYQKQGGLLENYRDSCLKKLPRGRIQISRNLTLPQLVKGVNVGSDVYVAGKSITKTLIQDQIYDQTIPLDTSHVYLNRFNQYIYVEGQCRFNQYIYVEGQYNRRIEYRKNDGDYKGYTTEYFVESLHRYGLADPRWSEVSDLLTTMQALKTLNNFESQGKKVLKNKADAFIQKRRYNQSLSVPSTHSAGKGLVVPFQSQVIVHGILQTPKLAIAANHMIIGRHLQDFESKMKPFTKVQDLSNFQVPTQLAIFTPTDPVALIHPPHLFRIDPKTLPPAVIISPNRLYLNPTLPRQYDPWFEIQQVMSAIQANLNRGYLDEATTQPEDIYRQLLKNAQDLYQQYQDQGKGKIPALQGVSQSIVFKESGTLELGQGKKIALTKPVLIYEEVALNGINSLRGSLVWPPSYEQATKSIRDNRGGIMGNNVLLKASTLQIEGRLHADTTGAYQTQNTIINGGTLSSGKDSTTVLQAQKLLVMQPTERVNEHGIKETVFAKVESQGRTGIEAGVMEIKTGQISSTSTDPKAMLLQGNHAHLGSVKTIHAIENGTKETAEVTTISSKGGTTLRFRQSLVGEAPYLEGKNLKVTAPKIEMLPITLRQEQQWTQIKKSWWRDTEKTIHKIIETNILPHYKADETITFTGNQTHTAPKIDAPKTVLTSSTGTVSLKLAPQNRQELIAEKSSSLVFNKQKIERQDHLTYLSPQITGDLSIEARKAIVETVEGLLSPKIRVKGTLTNSILSEVHNVEVKSSRTLSGLASALIALAITVGTGGSGSLFATGLGLGGNTLVIGAGQALVTGTATQFTLGTLNNDFDPLKGIQTVFSKEGSLSLATSIVSSGIMGSMGITAPGYNASMTDITRYVGTKTLVSSGINLTFNNNSLEETLRKGGINFVTDIVGVMGADYLGELYQNGKGSIDFATHKILHGVLGAGLGSLKGDPLAGALGGMVAETVADLISDDVEDIAVRVYEKAEEQGIEFGSQAHKELIEKEVQTTVNWSKVGAILAVSLAKRDIDVGVDVATNALENNFTKYIFQGIKYLSNKWGKERAKKAVKEEIQKGFSKETKELLGETNKKYKEQLFEKPGKTKDQTTLNAAKKELKGEQIDLAKERGIQYDHIAKVENAQAGLLKHIKAIKNRLGFPKLPDVERQSLEKELSKASKLLDHSEQFVPRKTK